MKKIKLLFVILFMLIIVGCASKPQEIATPSNDFVKGHIENNIYTNETLNLKFTPTAEMVLLTEEEMNEQLKAGLDIVTEGNDTFKNINYEDLDVYNELSATNIMNNSSIQISANKNLMKNMTDEQYLNAIANEVGNIDGFNITNTSEVQDFDICGQSFKIIYLTIELNGVSIKNATLSKIYDNRIIQFTISYLEDENFDDIISCFSKLK